jgi:hypothetical protein
LGEQIGESARCLGIGNRQMRFVQVHMTRLHALYLRAREYSFGLAVVAPPVGRGCAGVATSLIVKNRISSLALQ